MRGRFAAILLAGIVVSGCTTIGLPATPGERAAAYGYVPLDPLPVDQVSGADSCTPSKTAGSETPAKEGSILAKLPDQTIRFAVATFDQSKGSLTCGPATLTAKGGQYKAVLDYIQADAVPVTFYIRKLVQAAGSPVVKRAPSEPLAAEEKLVGYEVITSSFEEREAEFADLSPLDRSAKRLSFLAAELERYSGEEYQQVTIPVYVGVGLRLSADVLSLEGGVTLAGLSVIGAEAEAKRVTGTLTVQSLGVSGKGIATALPLPSKLDQTTIENAILAVGNMRATLYASAVGADGVYLQPRVVGLYSPIGSDPQLVNAVYSELSRLRPRWKAPCGAPVTAAAASPAP